MLQHEVRNLKGCKAIDYKVHAEIAKPYLLLHEIPHSLNHICSGELRLSIAQC